MLNFATPVDLTEVFFVEAESTSLTFISDVEYEFVGGGTAVNGL